MQINLLAIGKRMPDWVNTAYQEYSVRLPQDYKLQLTELSLAKRTSNFTIARILQQEAETMLDAIPARNYVIALTEHGQQFDTQQLAKRLQLWHDANQDICLLIGGPDGLAPTCLAKAQQQWSLSKLTLPHPLVRVIVAEQIYRAWSILQGHPYHRQ